jgi:hypothetical protein
MDGVRTAPAAPCSAAQRHAARHAALTPSPPARPQETDQAAVEMALAESRWARTPLTRVLVAEALACLRSTQQQAEGSRQPVSRSPEEVAARGGARCGSAVQVSTRVAAQEQSWRERVECIVAFGFPE